MNLPYWFTPGFYGALIGASVLAMVGFAWGGWVTSFKAETTASLKAKSEIEAVLLPLCMTQARADPEFGIKLAELKNATSVQQVDVMMKTGWATVPGADMPNRILANVCVAKISSDF